MNTASIKITLKIVDYSPHKGFDECDEKLQRLANSIEKPLYEGFGRTLYESFKHHILANGTVELSIDRKARFFRSELRRYTMTLSLGKITTPDPAYVVVTGKATEHEKIVVLQIGSSLLLSEILTSLINDEGYMELDNHIIKSLDHAFIHAYTIEHATSGFDVFSLTGDINIAVEDIVEEDIQLICHYPDIKRVRFFLKGGEVRVVSYQHMMVEQRAPLINLMDTWIQQNKRCMTYSATN